MNSLPKSKIRKEFMDGIEMLRRKILSKCEAKTLNGTNLNPRMFFNMVQSYCDLINKGGIPNIQTA